MRTYDAAFVPCREPDLVTREFPEDHNRTLERVFELQQGGIIKSIVLSGRYATWYDNHNIVPFFGTECGASRKRLIEMGCSPEEIFEDPRAQDSLANFVCSGQDIFYPNRERIKNMLVVAADERLPRLRFLAGKILKGVVETVDFESIGSANDPWLTRKEPFTLGITAKYLENVPDGRAGWPVLQSWFYTEGIYRFWMSFDAAQKAMPAAPEGTFLNISDIVASMDPTGLPPDIMDFAAATANNPVLV